MSHEAAPSQSARSRKLVAECGFCCGWNLCYSAYSAQTERAKRETTSKNSPQKSISGQMKVHFALGSSFAHIRPLSRISRMIASAVRPSLTFTWLAPACLAVLCKASCRCSWLQGEMEYGCAPSRNGERRPRWMRLAPLIFLWPQAGLLLRPDGTRSHQSHPGS